MMICLGLEAYGVGGGARRQMAWAGARHRAGMAMGGQARPDVRTSSAGRPPPLAPCQEVWVQGGRLGGEAGRVPWGNVVTDGPNIPGHASRHQAMRDGERTKAAERLRAERAALGTAASPQAAAEAGRRANGQARTAVLESPEDKAQSHGTAPELPRMRPTNQGGEEGGQAPVRGEAAWPILGACDGSDAPHATRRPSRWPRRRGRPCPGRDGAPPGRGGPAHVIRDADKGDDRAAAAQALAD